MRSAAQHLGPLLAVTLLALAAACSSPPSPALQALHAPPRDGRSRVVIYYPGSIVGSNGMVQVKWNDKTTCDLGSDSFVVREIAPQVEKLAFSFCGVRGSTSYVLKAEAGKTYYLRALPYDSSLRGIVSGYPSEFDDKMDSVLQTKGPLKIDLMPEEEAFGTLGSLAPAPHS